MISAFFRMASALCLILMTAAAAQAQPAGVKTVGLIAAMSDVLTVTTLGKNSLSDDERRYSIESWKISDRVAAAVSARLGKGFKVQRITAPTGAFGALSDPGFFSPDFDENYRRMVRALAGDHKADFYLAITPGYSRIDQGDQIAKGLGVVRSETLLTKKDVVHALVLYRVFDAQFRMVRSEGALLGRGPLTETIVGPSAVLEDKKRLPPDARLTATDARTREIAIELLDNELAATLPKLFARK
jgi:hypothetical protein